MPGEREAKEFLLGHIYMPPESKSTAKDIQRQFDEAARGVSKYKRQGEALLVGDFNSRTGKASDRVRTLGNMGK